MGRYSDASLEFSSYTESYGETRKCRSAVRLSWQYLKAIAGLLIPKNNRISFGSPRKVRHLGQSETADRMLPTHLGSGLFWKPVSCCASRR